MNIVLLDYLPVNSPALQIVFMHVLLSSNHVAQDLYMRKGVPIT